MFVPEANTFAWVVIVVLATYIARDQAIQAVRPDATGDYKIKIRIKLFCARICGKCVRCAKRFPTAFPLLKLTLDQKFEGMSICA